MNDNLHPSRRLKAGAFFDDISAAAIRIQPHIHQTRLDHSPFYSQLNGGAVYLKCENLQRTGSFKVRGALNKILSLTPAERERGVVTASTGNHGAAVAYALKKVGAHGTVFVPETAAATKIANIERLGATIQRVPGDPVASEQVARRFAQEHDLSYVPPYNDPLVIAGQGTIGLELLEQGPDISAVFVGLGGGGLIAGIAAALKAKLPGMQIIGCSPVNSQVMVQSVAAGRILDLPSEPTLSDGTAGGVEANSVTFPLVSELVDSYVTVAEEAIAAEMLTFMNSHHMLIEGAAAMTLAAFRQVAAAFRGKTIAVILCGANISLDVLGDILTGRYDQAPSN